MAGVERPGCWASRPAVRAWVFLVAVAVLVVLAAQLVFDGVTGSRVVGAVGAGVSVGMAIARPYVFRDGER